MILPLVVFGLFAVFVYWLCLPKASTAPFNFEDFHGEAQPELLYVEAGDRALIKNGEASVIRQHISDNRAPDTRAQAMLATQESNNVTAMLEEIYAPSVAVAFEPPDNFTAEASSPVADQGYEYASVADSGGSSFDSGASYASGGGDCGGSDS